MKKFVNVCLVIILVASMSLTAFAAKGGFLDSPSNNQTPEIVDVVKDCDAEVVITPYADRNTLDSEGKAAIEDAYDSIQNANDVAALNSGLAGLAGELNGEKLAVSDLFDVDVTDCSLPEHANGHGTFTIQLKADTLDGFVALMVYVDGQWKLIDGAKVEDGILTFTTGEFGPMAIVVKAAAEPPKTGDTSLVYLWAVLAVISAAAVVFCVVKIKKAGAKQ